MHPKISPTMCQKQLLYLRDKYCRKPAYHQWFTTLYPHKHIYSSFIIQFHLHKLQTELSSWIDIAIFQREDRCTFISVANCKVYQICSVVMLASAKAKTKRLFPALVFQRNTNQWLFFSEELNHLKEDLVEFLAVGSVRKQFKFKDTFYNRLPWNRDRS